MLHGGWRLTSTLLQTVLLSPEVPQLLLISLPHLLEGLLCILIGSLQLLIQELYLVWQNNNTILVNVDHGGLVFCYLVERPRLGKWRLHHQQRNGLVEKHVCSSFGPGANTGGVKTGFMTKICCQWTKDWLHDKDLCQGTKDWFHDKDLLSMDQRLVTWQRYVVNGPKTGYMTKIFVNGPKTGYMTKIFVKGPKTGYMTKIFCQGTKDWLHDKDLLSMDQRLVTWQTFVKMYKVKILL